MSARTSSTFEQLLSTSLNPQQLQAVTHEKGPLLVIAGAGSGKTRVITMRIAYAINTLEIPAHSIIALTFTNKAAQEMKERVAHLLANNKAQLPFVGTFHSFCLRLLRSHHSSSNLPMFSIMDEDDQEKIINTILVRFNLQKQFKARQVLYYISQIKNPTHQEFSSLGQHPILKQIAAAYEEEKKVSHCKDFDDLLYDTLTLFKADEAFKKRFQEKTRVILVDEYQDTNTVQHELLKEMSLADKKLAVDSICAVGDEDQSIYSWRGATIANMLNFKTDFKQTTIIKIEQNYRSVQPILEVANNLIQYNTQRNEKDLWSERTAKNRIMQLTCVSEYQEAEAVVYCAQVAKKKNPLFSVAVLYRTHAQSRALEEAFIKHHVPYKIIGGVQFYERKEIKDLLAYLKLVVNPFDRASFFRVINTPSRGLGEKFEQLCQTIWQQQPFFNYSQLLQHIKETEKLPRAKSESVDSFIGILNKVNKADKPSTILKSLIDEIGYVSYLKDAYEPEEVTTRLENINEFINAIIHFESHTENTPSLETFLHEIALLQDSIKQAQETHETVFLMTLHAAKGLEFDVVVLAGLEEGVLPSSRSLQDLESLEEERRLCYVGITRAKEYLLLARAKYRYHYGTMSDQTASRFLQEIPSHQVLRQENNWTSSLQIMHLFQEWFNVMVPLTTAIKKIEAKPIVEDKKPSGAWKKNSLVNHKIYGVGMIMHIEQKSDDATLTIQFKQGIKKISAKFVTQN